MRARSPFCPRLALQHNKRTLSGIKVNVSRPAAARRPCRRMPPCRTWRRPPSSTRARLPTARTPRPPAPRAQPTTLYDSYSCPYCEVGGSCTGIPSDTAPENVPLNGPFCTSGMCAYVIPADFNLTTAQYTRLKAFLDLGARFAPRRAHLLTRAVLSSVASSPPPPPSRTHEHARPC